MTEGRRQTRVSAKSWDDDVWKKKKERCIVTSSSWAFVGWADELFFLGGTGLVIKNFVSK